MPNNDLAKEILERVVRTKPGPISWFSALPADVQQQLNGIREVYRSGSIGVQKYALARAIRQSVIDRGHQCANTSGVVRWLDQN